MRISQNVLLTREIRLTKAQNSLLTQVLILLAWTSAQVVVKKAGQLFSELRSLPNSENLLLGSREVSRIRKK